MTGSVGVAYGILKGQKTGNPQQAQDFLDNMPETEKIIRNRNESRTRFVKRMRNPLTAK